MRGDLRVLTWQISSKHEHVNTAPFFGPFHCSLYLRTSKFKTMYKASVDTDDFRSIIATLLNDKNNAFPPGFRSKAI
jgi:hypothetical protein